MTNEEKIAARRDRIMETFRVNYALPYWTAYKAGVDSNQLERLANRSADFRLGIHLADPRAKWGQCFRRVDRQVRQALGVE